MGGGTTGRVEGGTYDDPSGLKWEETERPGCTEGVGTYTCTWTRDPRSPRRTRLLGTSRGVVFVLCVVSEVSVSKSEISRVLDYFRSSDPTRPGRGPRLFVGAPKTPEQGPKRVQVEQAE